MKNKKKEKKTMIKKRTVKQSHYYEQMDRIRLSLKRLYPCSFKKKGKRKK
jgi:hypothetical protein